MKDYPAVRPEHVQHAKLYATRQQMLCELAIPRGGHIAEIGVAKGDFSDFLIRELRPTRFYALDLFEMHKVPIHWGVPQEVLFQGKTHHEFYRDRFANVPGMEILKGPSIETAPQLPDAFFDLIYIDANHDYEPVSREASISAQKIKHNGTLVFNDYVLYDPFIKSEYGVVPVVNEMLHAGGWRVTGFALNHSMFCDIAIARS